MSNESFPVVRTDQRIIPEDFNRLSDRVEDALARWVVHFMLDPALASHSKGVVLHGFDVNQIGLPASQVRVTRGVGIVPWGPPVDGDRNNAGDGMSASWRLVATAADVIVNLDLPDPGFPQTDFLMVRRDYTDEAVEAREFRVEGDPDDNVVPDNVATFRKPGGAIVQDNALEGGALVIAEVDLDDTGVVQLRDTRVMAWPVDADSPSNIGPVGGLSYAHSLRTALADLFARVPLVIHPAGLAETVTPADGGPDLLVAWNVLLGYYLDLNGRELISESYFWHRLLGIGDVIGPTYFELTAGEQGRYRHGGNFPRAQALVRLTKDENNDVVAAEWVGDGLAGVTRVDDATWDVQFHANLFYDAVPGFGGFLAHGRWLAKAGPHYDLPGYLDEPDAGANTEAKLVTVAAQANDTIRVTCFVVDTTTVGGKWPKIGFSFWIQLYGPLGPSLGDEPAAWNAIAVP